MIDKIVNAIDTAVEYVEYMFILGLIVACGWLAYILFSTDWLHL